MGWCSFVGVVQSGDANACFGGVGIVQGYGKLVFSLP